MVQTPTVYADVQATSTIDTWLDRLEGCESEHRDVTVMDTNGKYSYGWLQFQQSTFDTYGKIYFLPHSNIHSRDQQYAIAEKMIADGLWRHWYNCTIKIGLPLVE